MNERIKIGMPVIINDCDRPCTKLVAIVQSIDDDFVSALYLCTDIDMLLCRAKIEDVTPLSDFGVELRVSDGLAECVVTGKSQARYHDGMKRKWQPGAEFLPVRKKAYALWKAKRHVRGIKQK